MSIYNFATGNIRVGVSLLIIYAIIWTVRQITDPKILGHNIGVHPLLTLIGLYVGLQVFGFLGLIIGPFLMVIARTVFLLFFGEKLKEPQVPEPEKSK
jgi:predicted PurR-regulated permease PerM